MRVAFFTPLSPLKTAIADISEGLLPHLGKEAKIDLFIDDGYRPDNPEIVERFSIHNYRTFSQRAAEYDAILYSMGNHADYHGYIYDMMQRHPGVTILMDTTLHQCVLGLTLGRGDVAQYVEEMRYAYGTVGVEAANQIITNLDEHLIQAFPLIERVLDSSLGIIVQNRYAQREVQRRRPLSKVARIPQHFFLPPGFPDHVDPAALRSKWGLEEKLVIGSFGLFGRDKRLEICLQAFSHLLKTRPDARYLLCGEPFPDYDLKGIVHRMGLEDKVIVTGWMDPVLFTQHIYLLDLAIHLRHPHIGGTPFTPIRLMGLGVPTIVSDAPPLADLPEGACVKLLSDDYEEQTLTVLLEFLAQNAQVRQQLGANGQLYIRAHHELDRVAELYLTFLEQVIGQPSGSTESSAETAASDFLVQDIGDSLAEWGIDDEDDHLLSPIAQAIGDLFAPPTKEERTSTRGQM
jgi:glycosyltransferase involved in cell wall biosynthesis